MRGVVSIALAYNKDLSSGGNTVSWEDPMAESILLTFSLLETAVSGVLNEFGPSSGVSSLIITSAGPEREYVPHYVERMPYCLLNGFFVKHLFNPSSTQFVHDVLSRCCCPHGVMTPEVGQRAGSRTSWTG
ncbi:uncharacterized protein LOC125510871 [Triticum urartu]|uniref:uncharacterized protein LOC125510871 n=1 Tax=Triticum urartu TaxID=4572 RepID=UPI0020444B13|nr:uncharacterized protein LOC125510871 [Triticum urartu]XP_048532102.1 uncharacterized protein LOC125510871 [Triticum urartu]